MSTVVIMPGGFHPFHAGHYSLYQSALKAFPGAEVYVAATNDQSERPFPFALKEKLAKLAGVAPGHFVQVKSPFQAKEITQNYNPEEDVLIFVRSEKDKNESPKPGGTKKDGSPAYFQPWTGKDVQPFAKHAYFAYLPTVEFGPGITSATQIRKAWPTLNDKRKLALVMSLYPAAQKNVKLAQNVVGMFDQVMGGQVDEDFSDIVKGIKRKIAGKEDPKEVEHMYGRIARSAIKHKTPDQAEKDIRHYNRVAKVVNKEGALNEFAPGNGDDGLPYAEYVVYQCDPKDQFEFIGRPLYQTDSLGMAHKYAYEMFLKHRPKAFVVYQPHKEASRGNYGVKGESDEEVTEGWKEKVGAAALAGVMATGASANTPKVPLDKAIQQATAVYNINKAVKKHKEKEAEKRKADEKQVKEQGVAEGMVIGCCPNEDINEGKIKDIEDLLARHAQYYLDKEQKEGPLSGQDIHSRESVRKQLLAKKKRLQAERDRESMEETKGLPFPGTYEQENDMFRNQGSYRITALTSESINVSESADYLEEK